MTPKSLQRIARIRGEFSSLHEVPHFYYGEQPLTPLSPPLLRPVLFPRVLVRCTMLQGPPDRFSSECHDAFEAFAIRGAFPR